MDYPLIQDENKLREMTEEEYETLIATGWTKEENTNSPLSISNLGA